MVSKKAAPIEKKYDENVKFVLDEALSIIAGKLESTNFSQVSKFMHFTG